MAMTKSRMATPQTEKRFRPVVADLVSREETDRYIAEQERQIDEATSRKALGAEAFGRVAALQFSTDVLMEAAFARIATLERELKATKSRQTKSLDRRFSLEDLEVEQIDDRNIRIALVRGDDEANFTVKFPVVLDRGVWSERGVYERGDGVTHGGGWWIARADNPGKPGSAGWRLAVRNGRDARGLRE
jgi:hypothetical protein